MDCAVARMRAVALAALLVLSSLTFATSAMAADPIDAWFVRPLPRVYAGDAASGDNFGYDVAISGDTAVIGAPGDSGGAGAAYVYARSGSSSWAFQEKLVAPVVTGGDRFGTSVAISGDTIIVGAPMTTTVIGANSGSADVYVHGPMGWGHQTTLTPPLGSANDYFGGSVAIDGNIAVVGAKFDDDYGDNAGTADVFTRSGTTWTARQKLYTGSGAPHDYDEFGTSVAISGTTIVVGSPKDDTGTMFDHGCAHVYVPSGPVTWAHQGWLLQPAIAGADLLGCSVAIDGDTILVGAQWDDTPAGGDRGSAHAFRRTGTNWSYEQGIWDLTGNSGDYFGCDVKVDGDTAVIGSFGTDGGIGSVYFWSRVGSTWSERQHVLMNGVAGVNVFGYSVGLSKGNAVVGSIQDDTPSATHSGSAYFFARFDRVHRFYNRRSGTHFYTPSPAERDHVIATWPGLYTYEGVAYLVNPENNDQPLYRFYNRRNGSHFYTASVVERDRVIATLSGTYSYDGPTYKVSTTAASSKSPVWRFYNMRNGSHFYTASESEKESVAANLSGTYRLEGTAFWLGQ